MLKFIRIVPNGRIHRAHISTMPNSIRPTCAFYIGLLTWFKHKKNTVDLLLSHWYILSVAEILQRQKKNIYLTKKKRFKRLQKNIFILIKHKLKTNQNHWLKNVHWLNDIASCVHGISVHWSYVVDLVSFRSCDRTYNQNWPMWLLHRLNHDPRCN